MKKLRLVPYRRVSTQKQEEDGNSVDAQWTQLLRFRDAYGHTFVGDPSRTMDIMSGSNMDAREGFKMAISYVKNGIADALVATRLDRMTRSVEDACRLLRELPPGRGFILLDTQVNTTTAAGRMQYLMGSVVAQYQRETTVERINETLEMLKRRGNVVGNVAPYGWSIGAGGMLEPCPGEQECLRAADRYLNMECWPAPTWRWVCQMLARDGYRNRSGKPLEARVLRDALARGCDSSGVWIPYALRARDDGF